MESDKIQDELPKELWLKILNHLNKIGNFKDFLNSRLVCKSLKTLTDEVLKKHASLWNSNNSKDFYDNSNNFYEFLKKVDGTRFKKSNDVKQFLVEMGDTTSNPFPNGTAIYAPPDQLLSNLGEDAQAAETKKLKSFNEKFINLIHRFKDDITSLVYAFCETDCESSEYFIQMWRICLLSNLKSLVIYRRNWEFSSPKQLRKLFCCTRTEDKFPILHNLKELQIFGNDSSLPVFYFYFHTIMQNVTHLGFNWTSGNAEALRLLKTGTSFGFSCLEALRVTNPDERIMNYLCRSPHLKIKEISIRMDDINGDGNGDDMDWDGINGDGMNGDEVNGDDMNWDEMNGDGMNGIVNLRQTFHARMENVLKAIKWQNKSMKILCLDIGYNVHNIPCDEIDPEINTEFSELKELTIQYHIVNRWSNLINYFCERSGKLEKVVLLIQRYDYNLHPPRYFREFVDEMWKMFPESVCTIEVPIFDWSFTRAYNFV